MRLHKYLIKNKEYVMSKQLLKSGTSIGANYDVFTTFYETINDILDKVSRMLNGYIKGTRKHY